MTRLNLLLILIAFIFSYEGKSQTNSPDIESTPGIMNQRYQLLRYLDKQEATSGVLYDEGINFFNWKKFDGQLPSDSLAIDAKLWGWFYAQVYTAWTDTLNLAPSEDRYIPYMTGGPKSGAVPIASLMIDYHSIIDSAVLLNLMTYDTTERSLYDVPNRPQSPYQRDTIVAFCFLADEKAGLTQKFAISDTLWFGNVNMPDSIEANFGDGNGYVSLNPNTEVTITWTTYGRKVILFRITLLDGSQWYAKSAINIVQETGNFPPPFAGYPNSPDENITSIPGCTLNIFYGNDCKKLLKPFIFIEGFNPKEFGLVGYTAMRERLKFALDQINQTNTPSSNNLWVDFGKEGYDLIYVDFADGAADLFDNADVVKDVIVWVNNKKHLNKSHQKNVVLGASMGGLLGYRALRTMEVQNTDPETEYLITFDSPMQGASIPLGLQALVKYFGNYSSLDPSSTFPPKYKKVNQLQPLLSSVQKVLLSPAAKQMLYYHIYNCDTLTTVLNGDTIQYEGNFDFGGWHEEFMTDFYDQGELDTKHLVISNGSGLGDGQLLFPGQQYLKFSGGAGAEYVLAGGGVTVNYSEVYAMNTSGQNWPSLYKHSISQYYHVLILGYWSNSSIDFKLPQNHTLNNYECSPAGFSDFGVSVIANTNGLQGFKIDNLNNKGCFGFVPTISSQNLSDYPSPWQSFQGCLNQRSYQCYTVHDNDTKSRFSNAGESNQEHVSINSKNATFLLDLIYNDDYNDLKTAGILSNRDFNFGNGSEYHGPDPNQFNPISIPRLIDFD
jgi:hypothetical protein